VIACEAIGWDFEIMEMPRNGKSSTSYSMARKWESCIVEECNEAVLFPH
jgi:hypothetical protein